MNKTQPTFASGEVRPELYPRVDLQLYASAIAKGRNGHIGKTGGFISRPGTEFIAEARRPAGQIKLVPFSYTPDRTYLLELGIKYMRVYKADELQLGAAIAFSAITRANPCAVTTTAPHGLNTGDGVYISGVSGMTQLNGNYYTIAVTGASTFTLKDVNENAIDSTAYGIYTGNGQAEQDAWVTPFDATINLKWLQYQQTGTTMRFTTPNSEGYGALAPQELINTGDAAWLFSTITHQLLVPLTNLTTSGAGAETVTINPVFATGIEATSGTTTTCNPAAATTFTFDPVDEAVLYRLYWRWTNAPNAAYALIAESASPAFNGITINSATKDYTQQAAGTNLYPAIPSSGNFPAACCAAQQRMLYAATQNEPDVVWGTHIGNDRAFAQRSPITDAQPFSFKLVGSKQPQPRHIIDLDRIIILSATGIYAAKGGENGIITPTTINVRRQSRITASRIPPLVVNDTALYIQDRVNSIRDLKYDYTIDGYSTSDLSSKAYHLLKGKTVNAWAYQETPNSLAYIVLDNGTFLTLSYTKEQEIFAFTRNDGEGTFEDVCGINQDADDIYFIVNRTIDGSQTRYIEKLSEREPAEIQDMKLMDSSLTYDGWNSSATTMTLTDASTLTITNITRAFPAVVTSAAHGLTAGDEISIAGVTGMTQVNTNLKVNEVLSANTFSLADEDGNPLDSSTYTAYAANGQISRWEADEELTVTASAAYFALTDVGNAIHIEDANGDITRAVISTFVSNTVVRVLASTTVTQAARGLTTTDWAYAVDQLSNLDHLEGESLTIFADGHVLGSPNNPAYATYTVSSGTLTPALDRPYAKIHVGLPFISDVKTLELNMPNGTNADDKKIVNSVTVDIADSRGFWAGITEPTDDATDATEGLTETPLRNNELPGDPVQLHTGKVDVTLPTSFTDGGQILIRNIDPIPLTITAITPQGDFAPQE